MKPSWSIAILKRCRTDFDMADKLYFEPVIWEHLWEIIEHEKPEGVIVQLGGQTALKLAEKLHAKGIKIIGTSFDSLDIAEDRGRFSDMLKEYWRFLILIMEPHEDVDEAMEVAIPCGLSGTGSSELCARRTKNENCD